MKQIVKLICCLGVILLCSTCYASFLTITFQKSEKGTIEYFINGISTNFNLLKKQLNDYNGKNETIIVHVNERVTIKDILNVFRIIKSSGFKQIVLHYRQKEDKINVSYIHTPILLKNIKDIPPSPPLPSNIDWTRAQPLSEIDLEESPQRKTHIPGTLENVQVRLIRCVIQSRFYTLPLTTTKDIVMKR